MARRTSVQSHTIRTQGIPRQTDRRDGVSAIILEGKQAAKPGDHYIVRPLPADTDATYTTFPEGPNEWHDHFRQSWALVRKRHIIDELSMVSAELFGALELAVRKVIGSKHTYKLRKDNSVCRFWGINVLMFVDFHQHSSPKDNQRVLM